jgi:hypothetical protein
MLLTRHNDLVDLLWKTLGYRRLNHANVSGNEAVGVDLVPRWIRPSRDRKGPPIAGGRMPSGQRATS